MKNFASHPTSTQIKIAVDQVESLLLTGNTPNNRQLIEICAHQGIFIASSSGHSHLAHEILETAINLHLRHNNDLMSFAAEDPFDILDKLEVLNDQLPPQSWRGSEQIILQQFSTPPSVGFILTQLLQPKIGTVALEPSAGTGGLAVWLQLSGCRTEVNELSPNRRLFLEFQGFQPENVNAEFLNDLLPTHIKPDFILMNPPFSTSGGRTRNTNSKFGFRHVESALMRLNEGGRLVCLLGAESCLKTMSGKVFWNRLASEYKLHCFLIIPSKAFYKYGTTFQTVAVVIDKLPVHEIQSKQNLRKPEIIVFKNLHELLRFSTVFKNS